MPETTVEVARLAPPTRAMAHVELLRYGGSFDCSTVGSAPNDIAATELVFGSGSLSVGFDGPSARRLLLRDLDGHFIELPAVTDLVPKI